MDLRAFSVKQPWAGLLMAGVKRFEVRSWKPKACTYALVHASSGKAAGLQYMREEALYQEALRKAGMTDEKSWPRSSILGLVKFRRIWPPNDVPADLTELDEYLCGTVEDVHLWEVGQRWPFPSPVRCDGKLYVWRIPATLHEPIGEQLRLAGAPAEVTFQCE